MIIQSILFLLLFNHQVYGSTLSSVSTEVVTEDKNTREYCTISKIWHCTLTSVRSSHEIPDHILRGLTENVELKDELELHFAYQTPVDPYTGELFVANVLKWRLDKDLIRDKNISFWIQIDLLEDDETETAAESDKNNSSTVIRVDAGRSDWTKRALLLPYTEFVVFLERRFQVGRQYKLTLFYHTFVNGINRSLSSTTIIKIGGISDFLDDENTDCSQQHVTKTRKLAGRWATGIRTRLYTVHELVNVTFFAAPKQFCIDRYELKLFKLILDEKHLVQTEVVRNEDLIRNGTNWIGHVVFNHLRQGSSYTIQVKPLEYRQDSSTCVCRVSSSCSCVVALSDPFEMPGIGSSVYEKFIEAKYAEAKSFQSPVSTSPESVTQSSNFFVVLLLVLTASLGACIGIIVVLCHRNGDKWDKQTSKVLMKPGKGKEENAPLIRSKKVTKLFVLNADESKKEYVDQVVQILKYNGFKVSYAPDDEDQVEQNTFYYSHRAICDCDNILLFHSRHTEHLIKGEAKPLDRHSHKGHFDDFYHVALSMLTLSDPKIIHVKFENDVCVARLPYAETLLEFPRDSQYFFDFLKIAVAEDTMDSLRTVFDRETDDQSVQVAEEAVQTHVEMQPPQVDLRTLVDTANFSQDSDSLKSLTISESPSISDASTGNHSPALLPQKSDRDFHSIDSGVHTTVASY